MKKFFQSKGFIVSILAVLCVAILGVCWFVSRDRTEEFQPDESPPSSTSSDRSDGGAQSGDGSGGADAYAPGQSSSAEEEYPKVTSESEGEVEIDFTDTEKPEETPEPETAEETTPGYTKDLAGEVITIRGYGDTQEDISHYIYSLSNLAYIQNAEVTAIEEHKMENGTYNIFEVKLTGGIFH